MKEKIIKFMKGEGFIHCNLGKYSDTPKSKRLKLIISNERDAWGTECFFIKKK